MRKTAAEGDHISSSTTTASQDGGHFDPRNVEPGTAVKDEKHSETSTEVQQEDSDATVEPVSFGALFR